MEYRKYSSRFSESLLKPTGIVLRYIMIYLSQVGSSKPTTKCGYSNQGILWFQRVANKYLLGEEPLFLKTRFQIF